MPIILDFVSLYSSCRCGGGGSKSRYIVRYFHYRPSLYFALYCFILLYITLLYFILLCFALSRYIVIAGHFTTLNLFLQCHCGEIGKHLSSHSLCTEKIVYRKHNLKSFSLFGPGRSSLPYHAPLLAATF